jgi:hypothetical protein
MNEDSESEEEEAVDSDTEMMDSGMKKVEKLKSIVDQGKTVDYQQEAEGIGQN